MNGFHLSRGAGLPAAFFRTLLGALLTAAAGAAEDVVFADFEGSDFGTWQVAGTAFGSRPAAGTLPDQQVVAGFLGRGFVNSYHGGDGATGRLASAEFRITHRYLSFLIGGGAHPGRTCLNLVVDGRVERSTTGAEAETLRPEGWDLADLQGRSARLEIVDQERGGWGHVNVDQIGFTDTRPAGLRATVERPVVASERWLALPVRTGAPKSRLDVLAGGRLVRQFEIELSDQPGWWAALDVRDWADQTLTLRVERFPVESRALELIRPEAAFPGGDGLYREPLRPQFHFSPRRGWNNDPNGLVFFQGSWHLFFQHNPYGWNWGNMHWGHAVSRDLVHWEETGEALYPDATGTMFSGSAVVDWKNTSGFGGGTTPPLVLFYTAAGGTSAESAGKPFTQCLAYSADQGRTWTKFAGNPVLAQITPGNRDPKVIWHEPTGRWIMTLYVEKAGTHFIQFFRSANLKEWTFLSEVPGFFECPDFFELAVDRKLTAKKWVLTAASSEYQVGTFDGERFTPETPKLPGHRGRGFYAAQTYSDAPGDRRVQIGWGQMPSPDMPFNQMMCFPCELMLRSTPAGPRLAWQPVAELAALRADTLEVPPGPLAPGNNPLAGFEAELASVTAKFEPGSAKAVGLDLRGHRIRYDVATGELAVRDLKVPVPLEQGRLSLQVLVDRTSVEVFAQGGLVYVPLPAVADAAARSLVAFAEEGTAELRQLRAHRLQSIWSATP
jgi:sucrose-6-phosphate hydrolase SacC (GH32 family)